MAEASAAAYGAAIGVAIAMAVVCFALRGQRSSRRSGIKNYYNNV
ncbi:MAG: hypothetical protein Ct9H300mP17_08460 [Candidatus Nitrosopelagicus sp.]|nr:MAG: hypothetical protein Ct9H300mP17_08460 [Candidatus Nitrosopelagicus sp.]